MSCRDHSPFDWKTLVARRRDSGEDPVGWDEAMARLDTCDTCRRQALMADPTLVFRRLPRVDPAAGEIESMRQAVASMRRASRVTGPVSAASAEAESVETAGEDTPRHPKGWGTGLRRAAAAALLTAAGLTAWLAGPALVDPALIEDGAAGDAVPVAEVAFTAPAAPTPTVPVDLVGASRLSAEDLASRPVFEDFSQPQTADVYQVGEEDLLVVMVVDETLDI